MATDYDAPRKNEDEQSEESIEELKARRHDKNSGKVDEDEAEAAEAFELPGADLSHEELAVEVKPKQEDEFTCMSCFLVHHRSQLADPANYADATRMAVTELTAIPAWPVFTPKASITSWLYALLIELARAASRCAFHLPSIVDPGNAARRCASFHVSCALIARRILE